MSIMASEAASSSSSVSSTSFPYQVFLSFRGDDTRFHFTGNLYNALDKKGIHTFMDHKLPKGEEISEELVKAIKESEVSIIVFSKNYAGSRWCLDELVEILQRKASNQQQVRVIFYKVDPSDVRHQKGKFGDAFNRLDQGSRYKDSMPKWRKAITDAANLSGWHFSDGESEFDFISKIVKELSDNVLIPSYDLEVAKHPIGIDSRSMDVKKLLDMEKDDVRMIGIWGSGGIGKSTIAKAVFNSIKRSFEGSFFLADVRSSSISHGGLAKLQETLLSDILRDSNVTVNNNVDKGVSLIRTRMRRKKVLLVLDDISDLEQLEKLAPSIDCFGLGSRIIITTRDERCLIAHEVGLIYDVKLLDDVQALELFSRHAFKKNGPPDDYHRLAESAVRYARGLPLALIVLGSHLLRRRKEEWEGTLYSCKGDHRTKIKNVLRISYDALGEDLKGYFLDIACFFKGKSVTEVTPILEACYDLKPGLGLAQLQEKALIRIDRVDKGNVMRDLIWMHDLIEEMGKEMGKNSRLWNWDDIHGVLQDNKGTEEIKGIQVMPWGVFKMSLNAPNFFKMKNLKYLSVMIPSEITMLFEQMANDPSYGKQNRKIINHLVDDHLSSKVVECSSLDIDYLLSNELRWIDWSRCPLLSFPANFHPRNLASLSITNGCVTRLWEGTEMLPLLKSIKLVECKSLKDLLDFRRTPCLESLILRECTSLVEIHGSVGHLHNLKELNLNECVALTTLPCSIYGLRNLQTLTVRDCYSLFAFPTNTTKLLDHNGGGTLSLPRLKKLDIGGCKLSDYDFLGTLDCLNTLTHLDLSRIQSVYWDIIMGHRNHVQILPECISNFLNLKELNLRSWCELKEITKLPPNLVRIDATDCKSLEKVCNLSEVLDREQIKWIRLVKCNKLGFSMDTMKQLLLNNQANSPLSVVFPGTITTEDAMWLDIWKAVVTREDFFIELSHEKKRSCCKCSIKISKDLKWENSGLAVFAVSKGPCLKKVFINDVRISDNQNGMSTYDEGWISRSQKPHFDFVHQCHVWGYYIPLPVEMKAEVDHQKCYSSLSHFYECVVQFKLVDKPLESIGVRLVRLPTKDDEKSSRKEVEEPSQQKSLFGDDDAIDFPEFTNPRHQTRHRQTKSI